MPADSPRVWDRLARLYDWQLRFERPALARALDLLDPRPDERLVDLGTGTGALLRELARRPQRPRIAVGVDAAEGMLARVPTLPAGYELLRGDVRLLPFPDESFEVAAAAYLLHLFDEESLRRTLAATRRVLVPGGRLVTVTPVAPRSFAARPWTAFANTSAHLLPFALGGLRLLDPRAALEEAGFVVRRTVYVPAGYPSLCVLSENRRNTDPPSLYPVRVSSGLDQGQERR